jgi:hypothetical protein
MASTLLSPGVAIQERDLTLGSIETVETNVGAIAGPFQKGPVLTPTRITSEAQLLEVFGKPVEENYEYWWSASSFLSYGGVLDVVRCDAGHLNSSDDATLPYTLKILNKEDFEANYYTGNNGWHVAAKTPGSLGNSLRVAFIDSGADQILTLSGAPSTTTVGTVITNVGATKDAYIYSWDAATNKLAIINKSGGEFTSSDLVENGATDLTISGVVEWYDEQIVFTGLKWNNVAPRPGTSKYVSDRGGSNDEIHMVVYDADGKITGTPNTVLEKLTYMSKASDARTAEGGINYYPEVLLESSSWIFWGKHEEDSYEVSANAVTSSNTNTGGDSTTVFDILGKYNYTLAKGADDFAVTLGEVQTAYQEFSDPETVQIDYLLMGPSSGSVSDAKAKAASLITIASARKDCIAFISPARSNVIGVQSSADQTNNVVAFFESLESTSYAVFDNGYKYIYDRFNDKYRYIPCNPDVAGLCAAVTANGTPWFSPAGLNRGAIKNAIKLAYSPTKSERDRLYQKRINPVTSLPGQGIVLFGDKTALASPSAFDRINVRRLFLVAEKTIGNAAKGVLFEVNDEFTRANFKNVVEPFLREIQSARGITDFLVVCDDTNNTAAVIDSNEFVAEIYIKPARSINFITLTFIATRTGVSFDEVVPRR